MADKTTTTTVDQATHEAAVANAQTTGAKAEKDRIKAILACDEGKARPKAAMSCAMNTDMSLDAAKAFLADLPEEKAEAPAKTETEGKDKAKTEDKGKPAASGKTPFEAAMDKSDNPNVGADAGDDDEGAGDDDKASMSILADYAGATGRKAKAKTAA